MNDSNSFSKLIHNISYCRNNGCRRNGIRQIETVDEMGLPTQKKKYIYILYQLM